MSTIKKDLGYGGSHLSTDLKQHLVDITDSLNSLKAQVDDLQSKFNAHTHTANDVAPVAGQQSTITSTISITK